MNGALPTREVMWNVTHVWVMYVLLAPTMLIAGYGLYRRLIAWRRGRPENRFDQPWKRLQMVFRHGVVQQATWRQRFAGFFHAMIFWGMIILTIATTVVFVHHDFGLPIMQGQFYLWFQSLIVDIFGALTILGVSLAAARRWLLPSKQLVHSWEGSLILVLLLVILVSGFLLEGWRIAATNDPWGAWSPFGYLVAAMSKSWMSVTAMQWAHVVTWWLHMALVFVGLAWAPYTKLVHPITAVLNLYTAPLKPIGASLKAIDFESEAPLGVNSLAGFTWKDLLDLDACTECGRCTAVCPANTVGKILSPRDVILDLQKLSHTTKDFSSPVIDATRNLSPEALWACTTCGACVEACPVSISQMPKIVDMRRHLAMEEAVVPDGMETAIGSLEARGHPYAGTKFSRLDWTKDLNVPQLADVRECDVLLWVGCGGALVERNQSVTRAMAQLLEKAGVKYAILGREERCTGDPARRMGNEFVFQNMARENIATLQRYQVKTVVTACPHCFNTIRNEYPELGGNFEVLHHSQFLDQLVKEGKLSPKARSESKITFHDPCYLGRQNKVFDEPRQLVQLSSRRPSVEMQQSREKSFCCGGGGGMSFVDEPANKRVNHERSRQIVSTGADVVAVGCPFCMTMLEDGIKTVQSADPSKQPIQVKDVAELLWDAVRDES
jgi:Fe-S oxidoreductase/nitrate reductase gamma subunit